MRRPIVLVLLYFVSLRLHARTDSYIDARELLFGYEGTFQDEVMYEETHNQSKVSAHKLTKSAALQKLPHLKDAAAEPGCIEVDLGPLKLDQLEARWAPVYSAAEGLGLEPYVRACGTGSGGGHLHIGAATWKRHPVVRFPHLLPNLFRFMHNHPSLTHLFGLPEELGRLDSAYGTWRATRQKHLLRTLRHMDAVVERISIYASVYKDPQLRIHALYRMTHGPRGQALMGQHNRNVSIEDLSAKLAEAVRGTGRRETYNDKFTLEVRALRPMPTPTHLKSIAKLWVKLLNHLANPHLELEAKVYSDEERLMVTSPLYNLADWDEVKKTIKLGDDPWLESLVEEYASHPQLKSWRQGPQRRRYVFNHHPHVNQSLEISEVVDETDGRAHLIYDGQAYRAFKVRVGGQYHLVSVVAKEVHCGGVLRVNDWNGRL